MIFMDEKQDKENLEKRRELRVPMRVLHVKLEGHKKVFFGYADNLSTSGFFIQSINPKEAGSKFKIEFNLPDCQEKIECLAEVVWKRDFTTNSSCKPGMGLRFVEIERKYSALIREFIEKVKP